MANKRISELPPIGSTPNDVDFFPVETFELGTGYITKRINWQQIYTGIFEAKMRRGSTEFVADGSSSTVEIEHNLGQTPDSISVTVLGTNDANVLNAIISKNGTQIVLTCDLDISPQTFRVDWQAYK